MCVCVCDESTTKSTWSVQVPKCLKCLIVQVDFKCSSSKKGLQYYRNRNPSFFYRVSF